jgi:hypothetical protein
VRYLISLKNNKCYRIFRRNKGGEPVPLRLSVNRMLGKVDELAVNADTRSIPFNLGETIKVVDGL